MVKTIYELPSKTAAGIAAIADICNNNNSLHFFNKRKPNIYMKRCIHFEEFAPLDEEIICCTKTNTIEPKCQKCSEWDLIDLSKLLVINYDN